MMYSLLLPIPAMTAPSKAIDMEPDARMKRIVSFANEFNVDRNTPIRRYYQSGVQMLRMADIYYAEEAHEKAYILYLKYLTLFVEKVRSC